MRIRALCRLKGNGDSLKRIAAHRLGFFPFHRHVLARRVPRTPWYYGDGAALMTLLAIQVITGMTMLLYYTNSADHAYDSVWLITRGVSLGRLVRGIHYWTAGVMVVMLVLHVFRHLLLGGYKAPREGTWIVGVFQFFLVLAMSYTGYVLRWDERGVYAVRVSLNMLYRVPVIGEALVYVVQGGQHLGSVTLTRFFSVHVWIVPLFLIGLVGLHLYLVILHGITSRAEKKQPVKTAAEQKAIYKAACESPTEGEWFYPRTVLMSGAAALVIFSIAFLPAFVVGPQELYPEGNLVARSMPREEWWFWWYSAVIAQLPPRAAPVVYVVFPLLLFVGMMLLPFLDRSPNRGARKRPFWVFFVLSLLFVLLWFTDLRIESPWTGWPDSTPPTVPEGIVLSDMSEKGRHLFAVYGCNSCHAVSSHGRRVGPDLAATEKRLSRSWLYNFVLAPPKNVPMPSYIDRITEEDLEKVVEFVLVAQTFPRE
ncbi:MAG: cytochrome b N-terminal domain-containing protein [Desulfobacterales bacterium]